MKKKFVKNYYKGELLLMHHKQYLNIHSSNFSLINNHLIL